MKLEKEQLQAAEEFVRNPTKITEHLVEIVLQLSNKYESQFQSRNILRKFLIDFKIRMYMKENYKEYFLFLRGHKPPNISDQDRIKELDLLFKEFRRLYDKLIFNNFALAYAYTLNKDTSNPISTMEDKKILLLQKLYHKKINVSEFLKEFGHYALNAYELASKRFEEYNHSDLLSLAKLASRINVQKKIELEEYINSKSKDKTSILIALRELAKYNILYVIRVIRYQLLELAKEEGIKDIFNRTHDEILLLAKRKFINGTK
jgi:hypothetical protein